jgi:hypothetical protein
MASIFFGLWYLDSFSIYIRYLSIELTSAPLDELLLFAYFFKRISLLFLSNLFSFVSNLAFICLFYCEA